MMATILICALSPELCDPDSARYPATASSDNTVKIWNVSGFTLEQTLVGHTRWVGTVCSPWIVLILSQILTISYFTSNLLEPKASSDGLAKLWSISTGKDLKLYQGHHKAVVYCALHDGADPSAA